MLGDERDAGLVDRGEEIRCARVVVRGRRGGFGQIDDAPQHAALRVGLVEVAQDLRDLDPHAVVGAGRARRFVEREQIGVRGDRGVAEVVRPLRERRVGRGLPALVARVPDVERRRVIEVVALVNVIGERATRERDRVAVRDQPGVIRDLRQAVIGILIRIEDVTGDLIEHAEPRRGQRLRHVAIVDGWRDIGR